MEVLSYLAVSSQTQHAHPTFLVEKEAPWSRAYLIHFVMCLVKLINTHCGGYHYILDAHCPRGTRKRAIVSRLSVRATIVRLDSGLCVLMQRLCGGCKGLRTVDEEEGVLGGVARRVLR